MIAATEAAATAAQAASRAAEAASSRPSDGDGKQWWKLLPKPPPFDHASGESEIFLHGRNGHGCLNSTWPQWMRVLQMISSR